jgi:hypothetical protein
VKHAPGRVSRRSRRLRWAVLPGPLAPDTGCGHISRQSAAGDLHALLVGAVPRYAAGRDQAAHPGGRVGGHRVPGERGALPQRWRVVRVFAIGRQAADPAVDVDRRDLGARPGPPVPHRSGRDLLPARRAHHTADGALRRLYLLEGARRPRRALPRRAPSRHRGRHCRGVPRARPGPLLRFLRDRVAADVRDDRRLGRATAARRRGSSSSTRSSAPCCCWWAYSPSSRSRHVDMVALSASGRKPAVRRSALRVHPAGGGVRGKSPLWPLHLVARCPHRAAPRSGRSSSPASC